MYARSLLSLLAALPYRRLGRSMPEMSKLRLVFAACYGSVYWVTRELPLWVCWAFMLTLSAGLFVANQLIPASEFSVAYVGTPLLYCWVFTVVLTVMLTMLRTLLLISRSKWAIGVTAVLTLLVVAYVFI